MNKFELIVFDFDGVMTDNCVYVFEDGREAVKCNRADGLGFNMLRKSGYEMLILSTEENCVVAKRAAKLKLKVLHGIKDKKSTLENYCADKGIDSQQVCFIGNDINDLEVMNWAGYGACPSDAYPEILEISNLILKRKGGTGVIREFADLLMKGEIL